MRSAAESGLQDAWIGIADMISPCGAASGMDSRGWCWLVDGTAGQELAFPQLPELVQDGSAATNRLQITPGARRDHIPDITKVPLEKP